MEMAASQPQQDVDRGQTIAEAFMSWGVDISTLLMGRSPRLDNYEAGELEGDPLSPKNSMSVDGVMGMGEHHQVRMRSARCPAVACDSAPEVINMMHIFDSTRIRGRPLGEGQRETIRR